MAFYYYFVSVLTLVSVAGTCGSSLILWMTNDLAGLRRLHDRKFATLQGINRHSRCSFANVIIREPPPPDLTAEPARSSSRPRAIPPGPWIVPTIEYELFAI